MISLVISTTIITSIAVFLLVILLLVSILLYAKAKLTPPGKLIININNGERA